MPLVMDFDRLKQEFSEQVAYLGSAVPAGGYSPTAPEALALAEASSAALETALGKISCMSPMQASVLMSLLCDSAFPMEARSKLVNMINGRVSMQKLNQSDKPRVSLVRP